VIEMKFVVNMATRECGNEFCFCEIMKCYYVLDYSNHAQISI